VPGTAACARGSAGCRSGLRKPFRFHPAGAARAAACRACAAL